MTVTPCALWDDEHADRAEALLRDALASETTEFPLFRAASSWPKFSPTIPRSATTR